jgi:hypothetical protein
MLVLFSDGEINTMLVLFSDEAGYHLIWYVSSQNNRYFSAGSPILIGKMPVHDIKVGVCCGAMITLVCDIFIAINIWTF